MSSNHGDKVLVEVRPFAHQVGGHTCVLQLNQKTICKPFQHNEVWFYENEPEALKEFTPKYLGETEVAYYAHHDRKCLVASISTSLADTYGLSKFKHDSNVTSKEDETVCKKRRTSSIRTNEILTNEIHIGLEIQTESEGVNGLETWSVQCIERQISRYGFWANNQPQKFIVLENLVHDYQRPCLMDLKMGRQQHGVDSSAEKRKLLEIRCASSTSATYGFRICGAQVYKANEGNYIFHDKYFGRALDDIGAVKELNQFFHNGILLRTDVIRAIMCKLEKLQSYLLTQDALRFDSCSLLIIYEGSPLNHQPETTVLMPDLGVEASQNTNSDVSICQENKSRTSQGCHQKSMTTNMTPKVDVRLIDFAHVSPQSTKDVTGNDIENSIVYGFEHLLNILKDSIK